MYVPVIDCAATAVCDPTLGCVDCTPGGTTCVNNAVHSCTASGSAGAKMSDCDFAQTCVNGACVDSCELAASEFVYLLNDANELVSFEPRKDTDPAALKVIGPIACMGRPNSMSVDRFARAWLNYSEGPIYRIPTNDPSACVDSGYAKGVVPTSQVGMGFVSDLPGSKLETLYLASFGGASQLWKLNPRDAAPITPSKLGDFTPSPVSPEMTGTGNAELYAYFPANDANHRIIRVNKATAQADLTYSLPPLVGGITAWAFAHWGGRFYVFVTEGDVSRVYRYDPRAAAPNQWTKVQDALPKRIVGAGVSTCAPTTVG